MKLNQRINTELDQNYIESQYIWCIDKEELPTKIQRINLFTFKIDFSFENAFQPKICITHCMALPNNHIFGRYLEKDKDISYLFIADKKFNIKVIEANKEDFSLSLSFTTCFYDDSIFIFYWKNLAKKYLIAQNRWIRLAYFPSILNPRSCTGLNQKILISSNNCDIWIYDIILDSYSFYCSFNCIYIVYSM